MDELLKFVMNHFVIFYIIAGVFIVMLIGCIVDMKRPKKPKKQFSEEEEMKKKIFELKNSPLAQTGINKDDDLSANPVLIVDDKK